MAGGAGERVPSLQHRTSLDGVRGVAILAVLLYHGGVGWAKGGFLGVEAFFVLSGYLITSLLVVEWSSSGTVRLSSFWARRARRLLPALLLMVTVVGIYYALAGPSHLVPGLTGDGVATLFYFGNWHQIWTGNDYFVANGPVSPFQHTWSLAIEEQFYVLWPLLVLGIASVTRWRRDGMRPRGDHQPARRRPARTLVVLTTLAAIASALDMALCYGSGSPADQSRAYYGTDTRAQALLVGAGLALLLQRRAVATEALSPRRERLLGLAGLAGIVLLVAGIATVGGQEGWLYRGGFLAVDLAAALAIAAAVLCPTSLVTRALQLRPLVLLGLISYGLYVWHFPLFLWLTSQSLGIGGVALFVVRLAVCVAVAIASYVLVEQPVRQKRVPHWLTAALAPVGVATATASLLIAATVPVVGLRAGGAAASRIRHHLKGVSSCSVSLVDTPTVGVSPLPAAQIDLDEFSTLAREQVHWTGSSSLTFGTCPPKRALLVGDSIAYTLGVGMQEGEQDYGVELGSAPLLGCSFGLEGKLMLNGVWTRPPAPCANELASWRADENAFRAQVVIVELGFRDTFDWLVGGSVEHLGDAPFDIYVKSRINELVNVLGSGGTPIMFLDVPVVDPPAGPDGGALPQASAARHQVINQLIAEVAAAHPQQVHVLDIDHWVAPHGSFTTSIGGNQCRAADGIHFTPWCGSYLAPFVFRAVRRATG